MIILYYGFNLIEYWSDDMVTVNPGKTVIEIVSKYTLNCS